MVIYDVLHRRTGSTWLDLARRMAKGTSILFAVEEAPSPGTVLSFELGLLWPTFMGTFGEIVQDCRSLRGFAFFTEAIFLGIYLYRRKIASPGGCTIFAGVMVALSSLLSAFFVTLVNAFMNLPAGFTMVNGRPPTSILWPPCSALRGRTRRCTRCSPATRRRRSP